MATRQEMLPLSMDTQQNKQSEQEAKTVMYLSVYVCVCVCVCDRLSSIHSSKILETIYLSVVVVTLCQVGCV